MTVRFGIVCLCLAIGAVAFNGESVYPIDARADFTCDEKGYEVYLGKWSVEQKSTSRDPKSEEFKKRLGYFVESCEKIHEWNRMKKYQMQFTFFADWHPDEFEELTTSKQRYSGTKAPVPSITPVYNNTNYRYLMPSMDPCDGNAELRELISKPQNCSVSWAFAITNSIEYAIKKMYFEEYDQIVEVSLSAQELIDCVGKEHGVVGKVCDGMPLVWGFDYVYENGIAYSEYYPYTNVEGECKRVEDEHKYHIGGYEKPSAYNKLGLFDLVMKGPVAVTMGLDPQFFQYYRNDGEEGPYFNTAFWRPSVNGVVVEYSQYAANGDSTLSQNPYFAVETRLRACDSMVFRVPILETIENANIGGIAGFAIRPIVTDMVPVKPTSEVTVKPSVAPSEKPTEKPTIQPTIPPTIEPTIPPTESPTIAPTTSLPTIEPTTNPTTQTPTTQAPTTIAPTTRPPVEIAVVPSELAPNPETVETIRITSGLCSSYQGTEFILRGLPALKSIVIGDNCFGKVRVFELDGLSELESVVIGQHSFRISSRERSDGDYRIVNCPKLASIRIGYESIQDYHSFELRNLPSLHSIDFSDRCFNWVPLFSLTELPQLQSVNLGYQTFQNVHSVVFENLPKLQSIQLGPGGLQYDIRDDRKTISDKPYNYNSTLTMRNLPSLISFKSSGWSNIEFVGSVILENIPQLSLNGIEIGRNSITWVYSLQSSSNRYIVSSSIDATALSAYIMHRSQYVPFDLPKLVESSNEVVIPNGYYNGNNAGSFNISNNGVLKRIVIGNDCFGKARVFELDGLSELESVVAGLRSFRISDNERNDGSCRIVNCPKLKSIQLSDNSFNDYHSFELNNLPSLQSIDMGSHCFRVVPSFTLANLPQLQSVSFGDETFQIVHLAVIENLPNLQSIQLRNRGLQGDCRDDRKTIRNEPFNFNTTLIMRNLPSFTSFRGNHWDSQCIGSVILENIPKLSSNGIQFGNWCFDHVYSLQSSSTQ